jgi:hypothetical protein
MRVSLSFGSTSVGVCQRPTQWLKLAQARRSPTASQGDQIKPRVYVRHSSCGNDKAKGRSQLAAVSPKAAGPVTMYEVIVVQKFKGLVLRFKTPKQL